MGSNQSIQTLEDEEDEDEDEEEEEVNLENGETIIEGNLLNPHTSKKVLEQEPEMLPCHSSASPLSPQLSSIGTPRMVGPTIKVWDPYNVLAPPPISFPAVGFGRSYSSDGMVVVEDGGGSGGLMEVYLINNGESEMSLRGDLINGRGPHDDLTNNGKRQTRALAVFLKSQGVRFNAVYCSPLDRAKDTALSVCQEMSFPEQQIQSVEALTEMSQGQWEGCPHSEIYTPHIVNLLNTLQPDFAPPSGESLRQVEFRMVHFLNSTLLILPEKLRSDLISPRPSNPVFSQQNSPSYPNNPVFSQQNSHLYLNNPSFSQQNSHSYPNSINDRDGPSYPQPNWDLLYRHRQLSRKKSGKSRLQMVTTTGDNYHEEENSPKDPNRQNSMNYRGSSTCIGVFSHSTPIKCLLTGILGCSSMMSHKICVEDSSVTVLQHSWKTGWQIKRLNDTSHLRLL